MLWHGCNVLVIKSRTRNFHMISPPFRAAFLLCLNGCGPRRLMVTGVSTPSTGAETDDLADSIGAANQFDAHSPHCEP